MADKLPNPESREEAFLAKAAGESVTLPTPESRKELFLNAIAQGGGGGSTINVVQTTGTSTEDVMSQKAVTDALAEAGGVNVVQTTGTSTEDVMSQNATTSMVYNDPSSKYQIKIGGDSSVSGTSTVAIGRSASSNNRGVSVGPFSHASGGYSVGSVAIGYATNNNVAVNADYTVALGAGAKATRQGEMNIGLSGESELLTKGFNNTEYRLISGVHDPVEAHDAATKGYVDTHSGGVKTLTSADYNYARYGTGDYDSIALWLLDEGQYIIRDSGSVRIAYTATNNVNTSDPTGVLVLVKPVGTRRGCYIYSNANAGGTIIVTSIDTSGSNGTESTFINS